MSALNLGHVTQKLANLLIVSMRLSVSASEYTRGDSQKTFVAEDPLPVTLRQYYDKLLFWIYSDY